MNKYLKNAERNKSGANTDKCAGMGSLLKVKTKILLNLITQIDTIR